MNTTPVSSGTSTQHTQHLKRIARSGALNLVGTVVTAVSTFGLTVLVARYLPQDTAGVFFTLTGAFTLVFSIARLAVPTAMVYFIARYRAQGRYELLKPITIVGIIPVVALCIVLGVVGIVWAPDFAQVMLHGSEPGATSLVRLLSVFLVFAAVNDIGVGSTRGYGVMRPMVFIDRIARPVMQLILVGLLALIGWKSALSAGAAWCLPYILSSAVLVLWTEDLRRKTLARAHRERRGRLPIAAEDTTENLQHEASLRAQSRAFWRFTIPRTVDSIAQMALQRTDVLLIGAISGPAPAAVYTAATRFLVLGQLVGGTISTTIQPKISSLVARNDMAGAATVYRTATIWGMLLTWPIYCIFSIFNSDLLRVFGAKYEGGGDVIAILSLAMLVATGCGAVDIVLIMAGRAKWSMYNSIAALVANLGLNLFLIPRMGYRGAAIAWAVAILVNNIAPLLELAFWLRLHPFGRQTTLAALLTAGCFGGIPLLVRLVAGDAFERQALAAVVGCVIYAAGLWHWRDYFELKTLASIRREKTTKTAS